MAKQIDVTWIDDLDGENVADETVQFGLDGIAYEIDLAEANAKQLRQDIHRWTETSRRITGRRHQRARSSTNGARRAPVDREQTTMIREWARNNGYDISARGRIPANIIDAYHATR